METGEESTGSIGDHGTSTTTPAGAPATSSGDAEASEAGTTSGETTSTDTPGEGETTNGDDSSTGSDLAPVCGDGVVEGDETCDDGNANENDGCSTACVAQWWTGNDEQCSDGQAEPCGYHGASCRLGADGEAVFCYWADSTEEGGCDSTPGIWTLAESDFAMDHPELVFPRDGACFTLAGNLQCDAADAFACEAAGAASCTQSLSADGLEETGPAICYWEGDETACGETSGLWTEPGDGFAMDHPNVLPPDTAACITQVPNL